jgi:hypothetical protein
VALAKVGPVGADKAGQRLDDDMLLLGLEQCCGSVIFFIPDPGSESLIFFYPGSGSWIRRVKKHRIPELGSRILLYMKIGMTNKTNFFLAFYSFRSKFY